MNGPIKWMDACIYIHSIIWIVFYGFSFISSWTPMRDMLLPLLSLQLYVKNGNECTKKRIENEGLSGWSPGWLDETSWEMTILFYKNFVFNKRKNIKSSWECLERRCNIPQTAFLSPQIYKFFRFFNSLTLCSHFVQTSEINLISAQHRWF